MVLTNFCQYLNFKYMLIKKNVLMYPYNFLIAIRITYEELCMKFLIILTRPKSFIATSKKNSQKNRKFQLSINSSKSQNILKIK
ncbi:hypothetical protein FWK35_00017485 [Aphis craccivora]|uniref:Uncharacterized protein n=1 Tax=Aphis craccivora TaxID=307492 RepID=A0A6G0YWM4_APHCR|nr:hypothetical protein FWK35_00017485 [Aphis craccivora]